MSLWLTMSGVLWSVVDVPHGTAVAPVTPENGNRVCHFSNVFSPCFRWAAKTRLKNGNRTETVNIVERSCKGTVMETLFLNPTVHVHGYVHILTANLAAHGLRNHFGGLLRGVVSTGCCWGFFTRFANGSSLGGGVWEGRERGAR